MCIVTESSSEQLTTEKFSLGGYINDVQTESRKITWPDRATAIRLTSIVLVIMAVTAVVLFLFDYVFSKGFEQLIDVFLF